MLKDLKLNLFPTTKNKPIEHLLPDSKFSRENNFWVYNIETPFNLPEFLTLRVK